MWCFSCPRRCPAVVRAAAVRAGQSGAARQGRQVALLGLASPSANGSAEGQRPAPRARPERGIPANTACPLPRVVLREVPCKPPHPDIHC